MSTTITEDHLILIRNLNITWNNSQSGAPSIDEFDPFDLDKPLIRSLMILLKDQPCMQQIKKDNNKEWEELDDLDCYELESIYKDLDTALKILTTNLSIQEGAYEYNSNEKKWILISQKQ